MGQHQKWVYFAKNSKRFDTKFIQNWSKSHKLEGGVNGAGILKWRPAVMFTVKCYIDQDIM